MQTEQKAHPTHRWVENLHILLWLVKDMCWAMVWKPGGIIMILPTVTVAVYLLLKSFKSRTDLYHNAAVCMWICANATWMLGEFFGKDLRPVAVIFFAVGLVILLIYYFFFFAKDRELEKSRVAI